MPLCVHDTCSAHVGVMLLGAFVYLFFVSLSSQKLWRQRIVVPRSLQCPAP